jgi:hypothetical protein
MTRPRGRAARPLAATFLVALLVAGCAGSPQPPTAVPSDGAFGQRGRLPDGAVLRHSKLPWDRPDNQHAQVAAAGLELADAENLTVHYHAHLDVVVDGAPVLVPAGLGINTGPGGSLPAHGQPGIAVLHTHATDGVLHVEAPAADKLTLGQVFTEWGVALAAGQVGGYGRGEDDHVVTVTVDGDPVTGDPAEVVLRDKQEIVLTVGRGTTQALGRAGPTS